MSPKNITIIALIAIIIALTTIVISSQKKNTQTAQNQISTTSNYKPKEFDQSQYKTMTPNEIDGVIKKLSKNKSSYADAYIYQINDEAKDYKQFYNIKVSLKNSEIKEEYNSEGFKKTQNKDKIKIEDYINSGILSGFNNIDRNKKVNTVNHFMLGGVKSEYITGDSIDVSKTEILGLNQYSYEYKGYLYELPDKHYQKKDNTKGSLRQKIITLNSFEFGDLRKNPEREIVWANLERNPKYGEHSYENEEYPKLTKEGTKPHLQKGAYIYIRTMKKETLGTYITYVSDEKDVTEKITDRKCFQITFSTSDIYCVDEDHNLVSLKTGKNYLKDIHLMTEDDDGNLYTVDASRSKVMRLKLNNMDDQKVVFELSPQNNPEVEKEGSMTNERISYITNSNSNEILIKVDKRQLKRDTPMDGYTIQIKDDKQIPRPEFKNYTVLM